MKSKYPESRIFIWGIDKDFLAIAEASMLVLNKNETVDYLDNYIMKGNLGATFTKEVKRNVTFEYHDMTQNRKFPKLDLIIARDFFSFVEKNLQNQVFNSVKDQLKDNGYMIVGDNESLEHYKGFFPIKSEVIKVYQKK